MFAKRSCLVVEQAYSSLTQLAASLRNLGFGRVFAVGEEEIAGNIERLTPDLIVVEASRSDSHLRTLRRIRAHVHIQVRRAPVVVVTADGRAAAICAIRDAGANAIVLHPFSLSILELQAAAALRDDRAFIETAAYVGPDRRRSGDGEYKGIGRRVTDEHLYLV